MADSGATIGEALASDTPAFFAAGPLAGETRVNSFTDGVQANPAIAILKDGS
jgi:hypothetical protein